MTPGLLRYLRETYDGKHTNTEWDAERECNRYLKPDCLSNDEWRELEASAASKGVKGSSRSDLTLPLAGWRGKLGVDWGRARTLFREVLTDARS